MPMGEEPLCRSAGHSGCTRTQFTDMSACSAIRMAVQSRCGGSGLGRQWSIRTLKGTADL